MISFGAKSSNVDRLPTTITCYRCKHCNGVLSISEFLERHCTTCGKDTDVVASREKQA